MNPEFDFDQYLAKEDPVEQPMQSQIEVDEQPFNFDQFLDEKPSQFEIATKETARHLARTGARVGETVLGAPGDIVNFVDFLKEKVPFPKNLKLEPDFTKNLRESVLSKLPTSSDLKEFSSLLTSGFTDPQGPGEEFVDDVFELGTTLAFGKDPTKMKNLLSFLGKATAAKSTSKIAEKLGADEKGQAFTEIGTLFFMSLAKKPLANKAISDKYRSARSRIPENQMVKTDKFHTELLELEKDLQKGISTPTKKEVLSKVKELKDKTKDGSVLLEDIVDSYHDINENLASKKLFDELSTSQRKKLRFRYDKLKDKVSRQLEIYGKENPEFLKDFREANKAYAVMQESKAVSNYLESVVGKLPAKVASGIAIELYLGAPEAALATAGSAAALKSGEAMYRISKSPLLRKHYINVIKASSTQDLPAVIKSLSALEDGLKRSISQESLEKE